MNNKESTNLPVKLANPSVHHFVSTKSKKAKKKRKKNRSSLNGMPMHNVFFFSMMAKELPSKSIQEFLGGGEYVQFIQFIQFR